MANKRLCYFPKFEEYDTFPFSLSNLQEKYPAEYREFQKKIAEQNMCIPKELWPSFDTTAPWEIFPPQHTMENRQARKNFYSSIDRGKQPMTQTDLLNPESWPQPTQEPSLFQQTKRAKPTEETLRLRPPSPTSVPSYFQDAQDPWPDPNDLSLSDPNPGPSPDTWPSQWPSLDKLEADFERIQGDNFVHQHSLEHQNMSEDDD